MLLNNLMKAGAADDKLAVEDVFSAYTYQGNGSTQTINNGIDLAGEGGMVWVKNRLLSGVPDAHVLFDTLRGQNQWLQSNTTAGQLTAGNDGSFNSNGFSVGGSLDWNRNSSPFVAWTFRRAPKFFDVAIVTKSAGSDATVDFSSLGTLGMVICKRIDASGDWFVRHRSVLSGRVLLLNSLAGSANTNEVNWSGTAFRLNDTDVPEGTYICYGFAHDPSPEGVIQCGSFTTDASGNFAPVNLGWEPQYALIKSSSSTGHWNILDNMRGMAVGGNEPRLFANTAWSEDEGGAPYNWFEPTATGFSQPTNNNPYAGSAQTYIYLAIRRGPMRTPTDGTKVYNAIARTGTGAAATVTGVGFAPDVVAIRAQATAGSQPVWYDRLRGKDLYLVSSGTTAEQTASASLSEFQNDGVILGADTAIGQVNSSGWSFINHFFRRAPGFFDTVCYTGTGVARTIAHNLKSVPGMIWVKSRSNAAGWHVYHKDIGAENYLDVCLTQAASLLASGWNSTDPTDSVFSIGTHARVNGSAYTYTAYLFGDTPGLCKAFSYTGNGSNQDIALGFAPRFVLLKRTDAAGDWFVVDSTRGIVSGADPSLLLNSNAAEVTSIDFIDPLATGCNITQEATNNLNVNAATYVGWAAA